VLTVTSTADTTAQGTVLTLREAVELVDGTLGRSLMPQEQQQVSGLLGSNDTIRFSLPPGPQTITLTGAELDLTSPVTITGPGAGALTIDADHQGRVFTVGRIFDPEPDLVVSLSGLTVADGSTPGPDDYGAGLLNFGTASLSKMAFIGDHAGSHGGGAIYNVGSLTLTDSTLLDNSTDSGGPGAGIVNTSSGTLTVRNTTFAGNTAGEGGDGGAINNSGPLTVSGCTFVNNTAGSDGAGINNTGPLTVSDTVFVGNIAFSDGGAFWNSGTLALSGSTLRGNFAASDGGGIYNNGLGTLTLLNSTVSENVAGTAGGGIQNERVATLIHVTVAANQTLTGSGGGIHSIDVATLTLTNCTFTGNHAASRGSGGAVASDGTLTVRDSSFAGNSSAANGGAIANGGTLTLTNCTLWGNVAGADGGAIANDRTAGFFHVTISGNRAVGGSGGGIFTLTGVVTLRHTLGAHNFRGPAPGKAPSNIAGAVVNRRGARGRSSTARRALTNVLRQHRGMIADLRHTDGREDSDASGL
jgi:predicted outer membrane repeat protein